MTCAVYRGGDMKSRTRLGMTLVELMVVMAIILVLCGIMAYFVIDNRESSAQNNLSNDIVGLINAQRSRAMSLNVASYVRFDQSSHTIEPRLGDVSACTFAEKEQYPIRYTSDNTKHVGIEYQVTAGKLGRALDTMSSGKYVNSTVNLKLSVVGRQADLMTGGTDTGNLLVICFQPNGLVYFMNDSQFFENDGSNTAAYARIAITQTATPGTIGILVSTLGAITRLNKLPH